MAPRHLVMIVRCFSKEICAWMSNCLTKRRKSPRSFGQRHLRRTAVSSPSDLPSWFRDRDGDISSILPPLPCVFRTGDLFSTWRDPSTGLAPFVYPLPPLSNIQVPTFAVLPLVPLATCRTLLLLILGCLFFAVEKLFAVLCLLSPSFVLTLSSWCTTVFARCALYLLGFSRLPSERPFTSRTASQKLVRAQIAPGDVIVSNWSSYVDVIYLAYLYNPIFIVPVPPSTRNSTNSQSVVTGFTRKSPLELITSSGHPPYHDSFNIDSLAGWIAKSKRLVRLLVVLPEGTTSNNRAILKFPQLTPASIGKYDGKVKMYCLALKHEVPTPLKNSITNPIPTWPWNLPSILKANLVPILLPFWSPRTLTIRYPRFNALEIDAIDHKCFDRCSELIGSVGKLKQTNNVGWLDKAEFLKYFQSRH
ncbi:hypothetical protein O181_062589 [Austropuccinia psidii MF-1]|uniref:Phospholipid/glycerol acyltransferase domain-containing protein n=1 Tax=Austropuccinia psidii MF-1 TaxID=1389203 RepID=A0A9Q3EKN5_9BASI|nr:hypothetical protein [Austropuccinia psidii MF-1]